MHICGVERGAHKVCLMISLVCLILISRIDVKLGCPEGFVWEVATDFFENGHIEHQTRI